VVNTYKKLYKIHSKILNINFGFKLLYAWNLLQKSKIVTIFIHHKVRCHHLPLTGQTLRFSLLYTIHFITPKLSPKDILLSSQPNVITSLEQFLLFCYIPSVCIFYSLPNLFTILQAVIRLDHGLLMFSAFFSK